MRFISLAALLSVTALSAAALAGSNEQPAKAPSSATIKKEISAFKTACEPDVQKYCSEVTPGDGRVASCLQSREDKLSPDCSQSIKDLHAKISAKMDKAELALRKSCGSDVQKFCAEVPSGEGRIMDCLSSHSADLSSSCKSFQTKIQDKAAKFMG